MMLLVAHVFIANKMKKNQIDKIGYFAGPGDVCGTFEYWRNAENDPREASIAYSHQFFELVRYCGAQATVLSSNAQKKAILTSDIVVKNVPFENCSSGFMYFLNDCIYSARVLFAFVVRRVDLVIYSSSISTWLLPILRLFGIKVILSAHCIPIIRLSRSFHSRLANALDRFSVAFGCNKVMCVSEDVARAFEIGYSIDRSRLRVFTPSLRTGASYRSSSLIDIESNINILFVGRLVREKGVFELFSAVFELSKIVSQRIVLRFCGAGSAFSEISFLKDEGCPFDVELLGHCEFNVLDSSYNWADIVVAPTRSEFGEGFNKVIAEAAARGKPVVTTTVCPAAASFPDGVVVVKPDCSSEILRGLLTLIDDPSVYAEKSAGGRKNFTSFLNASASWKSVACGLVDELLG